MPCQHMYMHNDEIKEWDVSGQCQNGALTSNGEWD